MYKDIIISFFYHLIIFILFAISNLFFYKKTELHQINVSLVNYKALEREVYTPLQLSKEDLHTNSNVKNVGELNTDLKNSINIGDSLNTKEYLNLQNNTTEIEKIITASKLPRLAHKDNIVTQNKNIENESKDILKKIDNTEYQPTKELFLDKIISGLDKGMLSKQEIISLNNQIRGCWYGQGGYSSKEDLKVELLLTMNPDATINKIEVLNEETYNTPIRKTFLDQVLRALKDPKCKQLSLPPGAYNNWRIIHIIFDPRG